ncbi:MAG: hypothetical protein AAFY59_03560 [Pseudomonadota bacterium]
MAYIDAAQASSPVTSLLAQLRTVVENYLNYRRTYAELKAAPLDVILDLDLDAGNLKSVARRAVYNR